MVKHMILRIGKIPSQKTCRNTPSWASPLASTDEKLEEKKEGKGMLGVQ